MFRRRLFCRKEHLVKKTTEKKDELANSCIALRSSSNRESNQDAFCQISISKSNINVMAVADGIGSAYKAEVGSQFVAAKAVELVSQAIVNDKEVDYKEIFAETQKQLHQKVAAEFADELPSLQSNSFGTTLIVAVDRPESFTVAYVGNGCAYHLFGNTTKFPADFYIPWNAVNFLNPHTFPDKTSKKESLYKFISYEVLTPDQLVPAIVSVNKCHDSGDIFVIGTDGLDSSDHVMFGKANNAVWQVSKPNIHLLCQELQRLTESAAPVDEGHLGQLLGDFMDAMKNAGQMDDDTTVGIVISARALRYLNKDKL